jgi:hypothetical protein
MVPSGHRRTFRKLGGSAEKEEQGQNSRKGRAPETTGRGEDLAVSTMRSSSGGGKRELVMETVHLCM